MKDQETVNRCIRIRGAQKAARATMETRVALIVAERGLTEKQMAKYFVRRRKNCKPRFDHWAFAKAQDISTDWLFDGDLRAYPRGAAPRPDQRVPSAQELKAMVETLDLKGQQFMKGYIQALIDRRRAEADDPA